MTSTNPQKELADVLWLGGGPDVGKTTVARILTRHYRLRLYSLDKLGQAHLERLSAGSSAYRQVLDTSPAERLAALPPDEHLTWAWAFAHDRFPLVLDDLRNIEGSAPILVEGVSLLPALIKPLLGSARQAVWLIPTEAFIIANWDRSKKRFLTRQMDDPAEARRGLLALDILLAERIAAQARSNGLHVIEVDGSLSPAEVAEQIAEHFGSHLPGAK